MENKDLVQTLNEKSFPPEQKWLLDISTAHFGIHQRINNLLEEVHNSPLRPELINKKLRGVALNDLWFYKSHPEANKALKAILTLFKDFLNQKLDYQNRQLALNTFLEFIKELTRDSGFKMQVDIFAEGVLDILEKNLSDDPEMIIDRKSVV